MPSSRVRLGAQVAAVALMIAACSSDDGTATSTSDVATTAAATAVTTSPAPTSATPTSARPAPTGVPTTVGTATTAAPTTTERLDEASFDLRPGTEQVAILDAVPGDELAVVTPDGEEAATGFVDAQGSLLFRMLAPGDGYVVRSETEQSEPFDVAGPDDDPPAELYTDQELPAGGYGYVATRDGTTLSANIVLPGPPESGPYPTVVEYSGYSPSNPESAGFAQVYTAQGFAYVGVNMRGTGCSGGSFRFFETVQSLDGYDVVEAVAAQPWVLDHEVGMVGISYPGISQLFVAATQPPSLNSISPLSVLDDSYRGTLYPGGILNTGFAVEWTAERQRDSEIYGQQWARDRAEAGDTVCEANQELRLQNPDLLKEIRDNAYYTAEVGDPLAPATFVDRIEVPVFLAGAWQDEQTGGRFPTLIPNFRASPHVYVTLANGLHTESIAPGMFQRYSEFLQLYVAKRTPDASAANLVAPLLGSTLTGVTTYPPYDDRFAGMTYAEALAAFEAEPKVRVLFEEGAAEGQPPGSPLPRFVAELDEWPAPEAVATSWRLGGAGVLAPEGTPAAPGETSYRADPDALPTAFYPDGRSSAIWLATTTYDWRPLPDGTGAGFVTPPLPVDTVVIGSASADLWIRARRDGSVADDTDLEVTISEVRPDGLEVYVQSGWLRASHRRLDKDASTPTRPVHTHRQADAEPLERGEPTPVRVEVFPFAHAFRAGSRIRLTVDAPGNARALWEFDTIADGETVTITHDADHPSQIVLPVVSGIPVPPTLPACTSLRGQPCRPYVPAANGG